VPGVAQRTGATIYYLEIFPKAGLKSDALPVMALMPLPGDADLVVASELMEAGRAVQRSFVTPNKTTLIASTHRVFSVLEKMAMGDGRGDIVTVLKAAKEAAEKFIAFDMEALSSEVGCVISSILFGAIAGSGKLPFARETFEDAIRREGKMVDINLKGFAAGYGAAEKGAFEFEKPEPLIEPVTDSGIKGDANSKKGQRIIDRINGLPSAARDFAYQGAQKLLDFQDLNYADEYLTTLEGLNGHANSNPDFTRELSRHLALWMAFDDTIRVAELKTRAGRVKDYREEVRAKDDQIVHMVEFMHPRPEEIIGMMPVGLAKTIKHSKMLCKLVKFFTGPKLYDSTKILPFIMLYFISSLKAIRRKTLRYAEEHEMIDVWLIKIEQALDKNPQLAIEIIRCQRLIKGYGETYSRGRGNFKTIMDFFVKERNVTAEKIKKLSDAALLDDQSENLKKEIHNR
jgi:indolepyruvate ferredoxin oxidoreductase beta subunit